MKYTKCLFILVLLFSRTIIAQTITNTLNVEQLLELVRTFHPVVRQTTIEIEKSKAEILNARGNFDPMLNYYLGQKTYDGLTYYKDNVPELKVPTWYGVDFFAGSKDLTGSKIDPTQSSGHSSYVGVNIPLAKNLVLDKRRATLKQAKIFNAMTEVEQQLTINNLCYEAVTAYWSWVKAYQTYKVIEKNVSINEVRLEMIRTSCKHGERPGIDTIESLTQLQSFQYQQNENWLEFQNAGLELSNFLWTKDVQPYQLPETIIPEASWDDETLMARFNVSLPDLLSEAQSKHPYVRLFRYKLDVLDIDKKLKFQELLPKVDFRYNFLTKGYAVQKSISEASPFQNNYQFALKAEVPLFFSQGRAGYKTAKLKIEDTKLEQNQNQRNIELKIKSYYNEYITLKNQVLLLSENFKNYEKLVTAEETLFKHGESSLFLINSRERKALEAQEKLIELKTKYFKTIYALQWSAGLLK